MHGATADTEEELIPDLDHAIFNFFPRNAEVRSRVRSIRIATVSGATDPDADGISDAPGIGSSQIAFGWGGIIYEWSASSTGAGINTSRQTPANTTFEVELWAPRVHYPFEGTYRRTIPNWFQLNGGRADALFGEQSEKDSYWRPFIFVPRNGGVQVRVYNYLTTSVTLINVVLFTIEPIEILDEE